MHIYESWLNFINDYVWEGEGNEENEKNCNIINQEIG